MPIRRKSCMRRMSDGVYQLMQQKERLLIEEWRLKRLKDPFRKYEEFLTFSFNLATLRSFIQNINMMGIIHIGLAFLAVYVFQKYNISFDINASMFISPIVFPLAFSINSDYQRREKVLEDLASFKSAGLCWYFCMREWKQPAGLDAKWIESVRDKLVSLLYLLSEYLLTEKMERKKIILQAVYDEFREANELTEMLRASKLPANSAIVSRSVHFVHLMCLSFERLRVVRDYRSPRSIRSFNKVFIIVLMIILAPYFNHIGEKNKNSWQAYYFAGILAFIFSTLQGVQDKLDDPFDGVGEDDINVDTLDEWQPILENMKRSSYSTEPTFCSDQHVDDPLSKDDSYLNLSCNGKMKGATEERSGNVVDSIPFENAIDISSDFDIYSSSMI